MKPAETSAAWSSMETSRPNTCLFWWMRSGSVAMIFVGDQVAVRSGELLALQRVARRQLGEAQDQELELRVLLAQDAQALGLVAVLHLVEAQGLGRLELGDELGLALRRVGAQLVERLRSVAGVALGGEPQACGA